MHTPEWCGTGLHNRIVPVIALPLTRTLRVVLSCAGVLLGSVAIVVTEVQFIGKGSSASIGLALRK